MLAVQLHASVISALASVGWRAFQNWFELLTSVLRRGLSAIYTSLQLLFSQLNVLCRVLVQVHTD